MLVFKHQKIGDARFISHIDTMRALQRTLRRADIPVRLSDGFNVHMLTYASEPLALGISSEAEYLSVDCEAMQAEEALARFNDNVPAGLAALYCVKTSRNPNLAGRVCASRFRVSAAFTTDEIEKIKAFLAQDIVCIRYEKRGVRVEEDVRKKILDVQISSSSLELLLGAGQNYLNPKRLTDHLCKYLNVEIADETMARTHQYMRDNERLISADEVIKGLSV